MSHLLGNILLMSIILTGCATQQNFSTALEEPHKLAEASKLVAIEAERDAIASHALNLRKRPGEGGGVIWESVVCNPAKGLQLTYDSLDAFGNAVETIKDVGDAPADTSYATYVSQFRKNKKNITKAREMGSDEYAKTQEREADEASGKASRRCTALYLADSAAVLGPNSTALSALGAAPGAALFALRELIGAGLAAAEGVQREAAAKATATALVPGLERAQKTLSAPVSDQFVPFVDYSNVARSDVAATMAKTQLGATVSLRRWFVAQQIKQSLLVLAPCDIKCLGDPVARHNLSDLTTAIISYRALAAVDTDEVLSTLGEGIGKARKAADGKMSWADFFDGLSAIADSLSGLHDKADAYKTSRE